MVKPKRNFVIGLGSGMIIASTMALIGHVTTISQFAPQNDPALHGRVDGESDSEAVDDGGEPVSAVSEDGDKTPGPDNPAEESTDKTSEGAGNELEEREPPVTDGGTVVEATGEADTDGAPDTNGGISGSSGAGNAGLDMTATPATPPRRDASKVVTITNGDGAQDIAAKMYDVGLVSNKQEFGTFLSSCILYVRVKPGTYDIRQGLTYDEILGEIIE